MINRELLGWAALHTSVKKRDAEVQTKMTDTIFLEPVASAKRVIFIDIRDTSDNEFIVVVAITTKIQGKGFAITDNPEDASYMLQANIFQEACYLQRSAKVQLKPSPGYLFRPAGF